MTNGGYNGYRIFLNDDSIIEHSYKKPVSLEVMAHRIVKFVKQNKLMEDVEGYAVLNIDPRKEMYMWRELSPHGSEWLLTIGRKEEE